MEFIIIDDSRYRVTYMMRPHLDPYNKNIELKNGLCFNLRKQQQETTLIGDKYLSLGLNIGISLKIRKQ